MVRSTIRKLYDYFQGMPSGKFYIDKVIYLSEGEIKEKYLANQKKTVLMGSCAKNVGK
jgi:hypothetical protein